MFRVCNTIDSDLCLTTNWKDKVVNSENKLQELVCDCLSPCYDSCTMVYCQGLNLGTSDPEAGVLTTWCFCSPMFGE